MDLRSIQKPLKQDYRDHPENARITITARGSQGETPLLCSVDTGKASYSAQAHEGVGGPGTGPCSGDLLLAALAACAQITYQMVAQAMGVPIQKVAVTVEGDMDLRGTLGVSPEAQVGFEHIRMHYSVDAPEADERQLEGLRERAEKYCVVMQTLLRPPSIEVDWK